MKSLAGEGEGSCDMFDTDRGFSKMNRKRFRAAGKYRRQAIASDSAATTLLMTEIQRGWQMDRRSFLLGTCGFGLGMPLLAAWNREGYEPAAEILEREIQNGRIESAVLHVQQGQQQLTRTFGKAQSAEAMFLLGSISKPICMTPLMVLFDRGEFQLDDPLSKFLPDFRGEGRKQVTLRHVLTHTSGLPDQVVNNAELRSNHAPLAQFVEAAQREPLAFAPGTHYQYSSMGILLAAHIAEKLTGESILKLVEQMVFDPLGMKHSAQGLGKFALTELVPVQTERAAPESGAGDPNARNWDWNSSYWRKLGAPWGTTHASAPDVGRFLREFLHAEQKVLKADTARLMVRNHNPDNLTRRGLAFRLGPDIGAPGYSPQAFGHTGSTGTIAIADPALDLICVVLTSLPGRAVDPHPRELCAGKVGEIARLQTPRN